MELCRVVPPLNDLQSQSLYRTVPWPLNHKSISFCTYFRQPLGTKHHMMHHGFQTAPPFF